MTASLDWLPSINANAAAATIGDKIRRLTESGAAQRVTGSVQRSIFTGSSDWGKNTPSVISILWTSEQ
jgi:hypothetical protein